MTNNNETPKEKNMEKIEETFSDYDDFETESPSHQEHKESPPSAKASNKKIEEGKLEIKVSLSLYRKLHEKSKQEGVELGELASELLSEGLVLRAWEIMERKSAMKQGSANPSTQRGARQNYNRSPYPQKGKYNRTPNSQFQSKGPKKYKFNQGDMGDSANFIEYVRSQEKKKSW